MAAKATEGTAVQADLEALPSTMLGEIVHGVLYAQPRPASVHAAATSALSDELGPLFRRGKGGPGGWVILFEPELHLGADVLVPDLAGWRRTRMPEIPNVAAFDLAPDWVCEVLSPSTPTSPTHACAPSRSMKSSSVCRPFGPAEAPRSRVPTCGRRASS